MMKHESSTLWSIDELTERVASALSVEYQAPANGQIRAVPDQRTIRYYTTLGLLDRPSIMQGRKALYGRRHLMQLVAVKRLQGQGLSLSEIQEHLTGIGAKALEALASLPEADVAEELSTAHTPSPANRSGGFWKEPPCARSAAEDPETQKQASPTAPEDPPLTGLRLGEDVTLIFPAPRCLGAGEIALINRASTPLVETLKGLGLIGRTDGRKGIDDE